MEKKILFIISLALVIQAQAQIGINTRNPQGVFHIDGKGNTNGVTNVIDDLVVDNDGNVGIGTITPQAKLDVMGNVIISGGAPAIDKILVSDSQGIGSWRDFDRNKGIATWLITATGMNFPVSSSVLIKGNQTLSDPNGMGFTTYASATSSAITVPAGTFFLVIDFDVNVMEYGSVGIFKYGSASNYLYQIFYFEQLTGGSAICTFSDPTAIEIRATYADLSTSGITRYSVPPFNNATVVSKVRFISLTK